RHYDVHQGRSHKSFTFLFHASSFITPIFLGIVLGSMILSRIRLNGVGSFYEIFIAPWLNLFCLTMGLFTACLSAYLASVFLVGETKIERDRSEYALFSKLFMIMSAMLGVLVFVVVSSEGHPLTNAFLHSAPSIAMLVTAALLCPFIWFFLGRKKNKTIYLRL